MEQTYNKYNLESVLNMDAVQTTTPHMIEHFKQIYIKGLEVEESFSGESEKAGFCTLVP